MNNGNGKGYRLAYVGIGDFRRSEASNYESVKAGYRPIHKGEVFLFVSKSQNQLIWILGAGKVVDSRRWRLPRHATWHPWMISEYAQECGLKINVKDFQQFLEKRMAKAEEVRR